MLKQVARIQCADKAATGFLVGNGFVLTALHNVADRRNGSISFTHAVQVIFPALRLVANGEPVAEAWDAQHDWVLLKVPGTDGVQPLPIAPRSPKPGESWEADGFTAGGKEAGLRFHGTIVDVDALRPGLEGRTVHAYQLFSEQAAAGGGGPVDGLSGAPCIVSGAVVGVVRSALKRDGAAVAGTLFATSIFSVLARCSHHLPLPDPVWGLPGFARAPLPASPVRHLAHYREEHAAIFFGRSQEIRFLYDWVTLPNERVLLLYGQSGVGKSSLLNAGLCARLRRTHTPIYHRYTKELSLLGQAIRVLVGGPQVDSRHAGPQNPTAQERSLVDASAGFQARSPRPPVIILDQLEEVLVEGRSHELDELAASIAEWSNAAPPGRIILAFRKEWLPEIEAILQKHGVDSYKRRFLERLSRDGIVEMFMGLASPVLEAKYGVGVEREDAEYIAGKLDADPASALGPTLQIALHNLWDLAHRRQPRAPRIDRALFDEHWGFEGVGLEQFVRAQLESWPDSGRDAVTSGLVLDVLLFHVSQHNTARERTLDECMAAYPPSATNVELIRARLANLYLLVDARANMPRPPYRLAHDTLAPVIRRMSERSLAPGQRARRVLERRVALWRTESAEQGESLRPGARIADHFLLNDRELDLVNAGRKGNREPDSVERALIEASALARKRRRTMSVLARGAAAAAIAGTLLLALRFADISHRLHYETVRAAGHAALADRKELAERLGALRSEAYHCAWFQSFQDGKMLHPGAVTAFAPGSDLAGTYFVLVGGDGADSGDEPRWTYVRARSQPIWDPAIFRAAVERARKQGSALPLLPMRHPPVSPDEVFTGSAGHTVVVGGFARMYATYNLDRAVGRPRASECSTSVGILVYERGFVFAGASNDYCSETHRVYVLLADARDRSSGTWTTSDRAPVFGARARASCLQ